MSTPQPLVPITGPDIDPRTERIWRDVERIVALGLAVLIGSRYIVTYQIALAFAPAIIGWPIWWPLMRRIAAARWTFLLGFLALANGVLLLAINDGLRTVNRIVAWNVSLELIGVLACAGTMAWVMRTVGISQAGIAFSLGMLIGANPNSAFNASDPLRFAYSIPITMLILFTAMQLKRPPLQVLALIAVAALSMLVGSRSVFGAELMALILLGIWSRSGLRNARISTIGTVAALGALAWVAYTFSQALLLEGILGEAARERTEYQIQLSGNLILGGRPEIAATVALIRDQIWGYGVGVQPAYSDVVVSRNAMWTIGYDPLNGYVENYMFGDTFRLHSMIGEFWAAFGIFGMLFIAFLIWHAIKVIQLGSRPGLGDVPALVLAMLVLWDAFFAPWFASIDLVVLLFALVWTRLAADQQHLNTPLGQAGPVRIGKERSWN